MTSTCKPDVAVVGAGPAGLAAAERLAGHGVAATVFDRMPSVGRKFLLAGRGGLNLTHSEPFDDLLARYGAAGPALRPALDAFDPAALRAWAEGLGQPTFVGSSGRVFPEAWKASPLLRAWLARLEGLGVRFALRHRWIGFGEGAELVFARETGEELRVRPGAAVLALGGASWPRLGSDGAWVPGLRGAGIAVSPLRPANMGVAVAWSRHLRERFAGEPIKRAAFTFGGRRVLGEAIVSGGGLEGGVIYGLAAAIRDCLDAGDRALLSVDLRPDQPLDSLASALGRPRGRQSTATFLRKAARLSPLAIALLREAGPLPTEAGALAAAIKTLPLAVTGVAGLDRAISSAGGVAFAALDEGFMLQDRPGIFAAGEMLDWEAPTGGYLLQACFATGRAAADGCAAYLRG